VKQLSIRTDRQEEFVDVTALVAETVREWSSSAVLVYVPHTTAGVFINEHADPDVARDIASTLRHMVPEGLPYRHGEGNSPAHVKAVLVGNSQMIPLENGRLGLGTWQGIFFAEFDGPRRRTLIVAPLAELPRDAP